MLHGDPPRHTRVRAFLETLFTVRVREITPMIDAIAHELLDAIGDRTEIEFVHEFSEPAADDRHRTADRRAERGPRAFKAWSDAIVEPFSMMVSAERELECARLVVEMQHYFADLLEDRSANPRDDLLTAVARAGDDPELHFDMREQLTILTIDLLAPAMRRRRLRSSA